MARRAASAQYDAGSLQCLTPAQHWNHHRYHHQCCHLLSDHSAPFDDACDAPDAELPGTTISSSDMPAMPEARPTRV